MILLLKLLVYCKYNYVNLYVNINRYFLIAFIIYVLNLQFILRIVITQKNCNKKRINFRNFYSNRVKNLKIMNTIAFSMFHGFVRVQTYPDIYKYTMINLHILFKVSN